MSSGERQRTVTHPSVVALNRMSSQLGASAIAPLISAAGHIRDARDLVGGEISVAAPGEARAANKEVAGLLRAAKIELCRAQMAVASKRFRRMLLELENMRTRHDRASRGIEEE